MTGGSAKFTSGEVRAAVGEDPSVHEERGLLAGCVSVDSAGGVMSMGGGIVSGGSAKFTSGEVRTAVGEDPSMPEGWGLLAGEALAGEGQKYLAE